MQAVPGRKQSYPQSQRSHLRQFLESQLQPIKPKACQTQTLIATHAFVHCDSSQNRRRPGQATRQVSSQLLEQTTLGVNSEDKSKRFLRVLEVPILSDCRYMICLSLIDLYSS